MGTNSYVTKLKAQLDQAITQRDHWKQLAGSRNSIVVTEVCPESRSVEEYIIDADSVRASWRLIRGYREQIESLRAENVRLRQAMQRLVTTHCAAAAKNNATDAELEQYLSAGIAQLEAERDKLAEVLGNVEREHELLRRMKNCEVRRSRGSFGIAVMSDTHAIEWQALDKELQQLIDARCAAIAELTP